MSILLQVRLLCSKFELCLSVVYYESIKREVKTRPLYECRFDERLKHKGEESTRLAYTVLLGELEHLKVVVLASPDYSAGKSFEAVNSKNSFFLFLFLFFNFKKRERS